MSMNNHTGPESRVSAKPPGSPCTELRKSMVPRLREYCSELYSDSESTINKSRSTYTP